MTDPRFVPSASLLLAITACWPEFPVAVPSTLESITAVLSSWGGDATGDGVAGGEQSSSDPDFDSEPSADSD